jgi:hypothetical protein
LKASAVELLALPDDGHVRWSSRLEAGTAARTATPTRPTSTRLRTGDDHRDVAMAPWIATTEGDHSRTSRSNGQAFRIPGEVLTVFQPRRKNAPQRLFAMAEIAAATRHRLLEREVPVQFLAAGDRDSCG